MDDIVFLEDDKLWIEYPYLSLNDPIASSFIYIDKEISTIKEITELVSDLAQRAEGEMYISLNFDNNDSAIAESLFVVLACFIIRRLKLKPIRSIQYIKSCLVFEDIYWKPTKQQLWLTNNYKPPIKALFCGDRNSSICFENMITFELKGLPKDSIVIHGGCKGIDLTSEHLAKLLGIETKIFEVTKEDWQTIGPAAGPLRNRKMLDEGIDIVIAFHPDISMSKGTKDMMLQAWRANIPVYIHDLKRKSKFEGDFTDL